LSSAEIGKFGGSIFGYWINVVTSIVQTVTPKVNETTVENPSATPTPAQTPTLTPGYTQTPTSTPTTSPTPTQTQISTPTPTTTIQINPFVTTNKPGYQIGENLSIRGTAAPNVTVAIQILDPTGIRKNIVKTIADEYGNYSVKEVYTFLKGDSEGEWKIKANWLYKGGKFVSTIFTLPEATSTTVTSTPPTTSTPSPTPTPTPSAVTSEHQELVLYALELINQDRADYGLAPVELGDNEAAQKHAEDMLENRYLSHWDLNGTKPYMRYTQCGGIGYVGQNAAYYGSFYYEPYAMTLDPKESIDYLEYSMMYNDAASGWGHRDNILDKWHNKVNIGIAYDRTTVTLVQDFEDDYINWNIFPYCENGYLSLSGETSLGEVQSIAINYDTPPQPLTKEQLLNPPYDGSYTYGESWVYVIPPPPPETYYPTLESDMIQASKWSSPSSGSFDISANISTFLKHGDGVYTIVIWAEINGEDLPLTTYSIFIE